MVHLFDLILGVLLLMGNVINMIEDWICCLTPRLSIGIYNLDQGCFVFLAIFACMFVHNSVEKISMWTQINTKV